MEPILKISMESFRKSFFSDYGPGGRPASNSWMKISADRSRDKLGTLHFQGF